MGTLTDAVISTTYKKLLFQKGDNKLYYTDGSDADSEVTTFASPMSFSGLITAALGIKLSNGTIFDSNGNESIQLTATGSAVGYLGITNSATGNAVTITTAGETNVGLTLTPAGSGIVTSTPKFVASAGVQLGNDIIYNSEGTIALQLDNDEDLTITGDLKVSGGIIDGPTDADLTIKSEADVIFQADSDTGGSNNFLFKSGGGSTYLTISETGNITMHSGAELQTRKIAYTDGDDALTIGDGGTLTTAGLLTLGGNLVIPDSGNIGSASDTDAITISSAGVVTVSQNIIQSGASDNTFASKVLLNGNTGPTSGTGITDATGEVHKSWVERYGTVIKTSILIDVTGLRHSAAGDIIGNDGTSNPCHIGQITTALNGTIFSGRMTCLEQPTVQDMDLYAATEGTGVEDAAISTLTEKQVINGGDQSLGTTTIFDNANLPAGNDYLYLVCQGSGDADYSAGKFLIELWGTV
tara:strand:+ start:1205 stop:2611 length:1407 start_codon:yes stop_codon:yes gene_type:complete